VAAEEGPAALPSVGEGAAVSAASAVSGAGGGVGESIARRRHVYPAAKFWWKGLGS
jgi:hypothetical protein